jgi:hypothetical protein
MDKQKQKQKREHSRRLDALVVGCAIGSGCDEAEWVRLAIEYAHEFRCPYEPGDNAPIDNAARTNPAGHNALVQMQRI